MKRAALVKHSEQQGCRMLLGGARHFVYVNPANNRTSAVPRHTEICDMLARKICRDLGIADP
jgi:mRNA interferase HicA